MLSVKKPFIYLVPGALKNRLFSINSFTVIMVPIVRIVIVLYLNLVN